MPNQAIVWLPLLQYLTIPAMLLTQNYSLIVPRALNILLGSATVFVTYFTCLKVQGNRWHAVAGALILAFQPWHIDFSILGTSKILAAFFIIVSLYAFITHRASLLAVSSFMGMLSSYEAWVTTAFMLMIAWRSRIFTRFTAYSGFFSALVLWCVWSFANTGNPLAWISGYLVTLGWKPKLDLAVSLFYFNVSLVMTFFVFFIGVLMGLLKSRESRILATLCIFYIAFYSIAHVTAFDPGDIARVVPILPVMAVIAAPVVPIFRGSRRRRALVVFGLLLVLFTPYLFQIAIGPRKAYVIMPEYRASQKIAALYAEGAILTDSPTIIYYSGLNPKVFMSFNEIAWYGETRDNARLLKWLMEKRVTIIVWENATFSTSPTILPELGNGKERRIGGASFEPIYEESLKLRKLRAIPYWEFDEPGSPDIIIYEVTLGG